MSEPAKCETECWMIFDRGTWKSGMFRSETDARYHKSWLTPFYMDVVKVRVTIEPIEQEAGE